MFRVLAIENEIYLQQILTAMKNIVLTLLTGLIISLSAFAQNYTVTVYGTVMIVSENSVSPVPDQAVTISIDSVNFGFTYQNTVYTNDSGYYEDIVELPGYSGYAFVQTMTYDSCLGQYQYNAQPILPGATLAPMDFYLCNSIPPDCQASFYYYQADPADPYTFAFVNQSFGNYTQVLWDFGDSNYSSEEYPVHTFPGEGAYYVCLTISGPDGCTSSYCDFVNTGGGWTGCENYFFYTYNEPYTLNFEGFLMNGQYAQYYSWDFGDGTFGNGQTVTHTYTPQGNVNVYMVGLTTMVLDSLGMDSCFYTSYQEVWIQNQPGCNAYFTYYPDSLNQLIINFLDMSYDPNGFPPDSWFWEFGDGTSSTLQNPVHTYADSGYYMVCLTIADSAGMCTSTYCEEVFTGYPPPPSDCESFILPLNMYGLTVDFEGYTISQYETDYTWEFGDGVTGTGQFVSHTYPATGMYTVTLQTVDATGCTFQTFTQIWLDSLNQGCSNLFTYEQVDSTTFTFSGFIYLNNGMIYPDSTSVYSWDFGDGTTATGQTVTHYFQENPAGGYNVCLTTTTILPDGTACSAVYCENIFLVSPTFYIYGAVYLGNNQVADQAMVHLMAMDTTWQNVYEVQSTTIDSGGFYSFEAVPMYDSRLFYVQAELTEGSAYFGQYVPTYHLNALNWESAIPILPIASWPADIYMIAGSPVDGGNGAITGVVSDLGSRGLMNNVEVVLMDEDKNPLSYLRSDEYGSFTFENLAFGTYIIHAEIMGIHTIQAEVTLTDQQPVVSVEVQVSGGEANVVFGVKEHNISLDHVSEIYPNPVNDNAKLDLSVKQAVNVEISIFSQTGQLMSENELFLSTGNHDIKLDTGTLPSGLYLLRITTGQGELISKKFMKAR
jgi:PKD repeat protein